MGTGRRPTTKLRARALVRQKTALSLVGEGLPLTAIATRLNVSVQMVRKYLRKALETESLFPSSLSAEEVGKLRQVQAEILANSRQRVIETHAAVAARIGTEEEKNMDATASARLLEAVVRSIDLEASLSGTRVPTRVVQETLTMQVRLNQSDKGPMLTWDRSILAKPIGPVPGLTFFEGCRTAQLEASTTVVEPQITNGTTTA